jgi:hypothetical protein
MKRGAVLIVWVLRKLWQGAMAKRAGKWQERLAV